MVDVKCPDCGDPFDPETEGTWVRTSRLAGHDVCLNCRHDHRFDCGLCGEWCDKDPYANEIGSDVFVMRRFCDAGSEVRAPGIYRILRGPFLWGSIIGEPSFIPDRIERVAPLPCVPVDDDGAACSPVCEDCQRKYLGQVRHMRRVAA